MYEYVHACILGIGYVCKNHGFFTDKNLILCKNMRMQFTDIFTLSWKSSTASAFLYP